MRNRVPTALAALSLFTFATAVGAQNIPAPVLKPPPKIVSLHRPTAEWKVVTTIDLAIEPTTTPTVARIFRWTKPPHGEIKCNDLPEATREVKMPAGSSSVRCTYQPDVGFRNDTDTFTYDAAFEGGPFAPQATVSIEVRERGLRWEFKTNASTVTSDAPDPQALAQIPSIIGGTSQDFLFTVNWQTMRPTRPLTDAAKSETAAMRSDPAAVLPRARLNLRNVMASQSANYMIETGVQTDAVAATVTDVGRSATDSGAAPSGTGTTSEQAVARRNLVLRGEFNYNAGFDADGVGRFVEVGGVGKGGFSTVLESNESFKEAVGRVLQVVPKDRNAYKIEGGFRVAIKQPHETDTTTLVNPSGEIEPPTNMENMFLLEVMWRFDTSVSGLATDGTTGDSRKRFAIRAEFSPEIKGLPGHQLPTIGFEISRAWNGGPPAVKVTYGLNLSATKGIVKD